MDVCLPKGLDPARGCIESANGFLNVDSSFGFLGSVEEVVSAAAAPKIPGLGGVGVPNRSGLGSWGVLSPNTLLPPNTATGALKGLEGWSDEPNVDVAVLGAALNKEGCDELKVGAAALDGALKRLEGWPEVPNVDVKLGGGALKRLEAESGEEPSALGGGALKRFEACSEGTNVAFVPKIDAFCGDG